MTCQYQDADDHTAGPSSAYPEQMRPLLDAQGVLAFVDGFRGPNDRNMTQQMREEYTDEAFTAIMGKAMFTPEECALGCALMWERGV